MPGIEIKLVRPHLDALLERYRAVIGRDFDGYRNHAYRAVTYAMCFAGSAPEHERAIETAFAYHDIGLWTAEALAYLEPSEALALSDNETLHMGLDPQLLRGAIHWHHKLFPYKGAHREVIEACRKADWIDASQGVLRKGLPASAIREVESAFPNHGFHHALLRLAKDYGGSTIVGAIKVTAGIVKV